MGFKNLTSVSEFILVGLTNHRTTQILLFMVVLIMYLFTVLGNLMIIILVQIDIHLRTPMYFFLTNLSSLEICFVTTTVPQLLAHLTAGKRVIPFVSCAAQMYIGSVLACSESFLLAAMAYDRYLAICHPLMYTIIMGTWRPLQLSLASWTTGSFLASIIVIAILRHPFCGPNRVNHFACEGPLLLKLTCADTHVTQRITFVVGALILLVPLCVILISYGFILSSVLQIRAGAGRRKAFSTCASHLVVVSLFYVTSTFVYVIPQSARSPDYDKKMAFFYLVVTPLLNPIIYTLRNKDVHEAAAKVLQRIFNKKK